MTALVQPAATPRTLQGGPRLKRPAGAKPIGTWRRLCGYCGQTTQVVTDGRMLLCSVCGH